MCELSFRSYLAERFSEWELLASRLTLEDDEFAYGNTLDLLTAEPDLVGLYVAVVASPAYCGSCAAFRNRRFACLWWCAMT